MSDLAPFPPPSPILLRRQGCPFHTARRDRPHLGDQPSSVLALVSRPLPWWRSSPSRPCRGGPGEPSA